LGLAHPRASWFRAVSQWTNAAALPAEFVKCVSAEELRARLAGGRRWSAVLVDASIPAVDRDLVDAARVAGAAVLVVDDGRRAARDWQALEIPAVLRSDFDRDELQHALAAHTKPVSSATTVTPPIPNATPISTRGRVYTCVGAGGTGTSTIAIAVAQAAAGRRGSANRRVVLADFKLHAEQAVLHDARELVPGLQELVDAHRTMTIAAERVRSLTFHVVERGYDLLLGLRRARFWTSMRPRTVAAAVDSLRGAYDVIVCDADADVEGETDSGAMEVEERNVLARAGIGVADAVAVVGDPTFKGLHAIGRVVDGIVRFGTPPARVVPVVNRAPARGHRTIAAALHEFLRTATGAVGTAPPVFVADRRGTTEALHDGTRLADGIGGPVLAALEAVAEWAALRADDHEPFVPVPPGSLGVFSD
jgi:MinD-like ATPase involved in chromosome partitioning or flagellar assembly